MKNFKKGNKKARNVQTQFKLPLKIHTYAGNVTCKFVDYNSSSVLQRVYTKTYNLTYILAKQNLNLKSGRFGTFDPGM